MSRAASWADLDHDRRAQVLSVLEHRFGDGTVYLCGSADREAHAIGCAMGLIGADGLITTEGRRRAARGLA